MNDTDNQLFNAFKQHLKKMKHYEEALGLLYWDLRTGAPKKSVQSRSEAIGLLSADLFAMATSSEMGHYVQTLSEASVLEQLPRIDRRLVLESKKEYDRNILIPPQRYQEYVVLVSQAESIWEEAKELSDWVLFEPYLQKIIDFTHEFIGYWGYKGNSKYDTLLDQYEPGMTVSHLDGLFQGLRSKLVPLAAAIAEAAHQPATGFLQQTFPKEQQKQFSLFILEQMGFDFTAGRLDESVHPFATGLAPGDVRITTRYLEEDVVSALFGTIHEGGHALYEQNIGADLIDTPLHTGTSMGIHESQSRFWENVVGRSRQFWQRYYPDLQAKFSEQLADVDAETFYQGINTVAPSLIRIEADELTYNLHIMIRYEMEKAIFDDHVPVSELPALWDEKYKEYLGVAPTHAGEGILQDVHWSGGAFGYFPSYSLGNMYAAQFTKTLASKIPEWSNLIASGTLLPIKEWLTEQIYQYGKSETPAEIIERVTGEPLNSAYLIDYLEQKYKDIYRL